MGIPEWILLEYRVVLLRLQVRAPSKLGVSCAVQVRAERVPEGESPMGPRASPSIRTESCGYEGRRNPNDITEA